MLYGVRGGCRDEIFFFFFAVSEDTLKCISFRTIPKFLDRKTTGDEISNFFTLSFSLHTLSAALGKEKLRTHCSYQAQWHGLGGLMQVPTRHPDSPFSLSEGFSCLLFGLLTVTWREHSRTRVQTGLMRAEEMPPQLCYWSFQDRDPNSRAGFNAGVSSPSWEKVGSGLLPLSLLQAGW